MFLRSWLKWVVTCANWFCTGNICPLQLKCHRKGKKGLITQTGRAMLSRSERGEDMELKLTQRGSIFNTWPPWHYAEWAQRCVPALLAFALTMLISENDMIFSWDSWPTFSSDNYTEFITQILIVRVFSAVSCIKCFISQYRIIFHHYF